MAALKKVIDAVLDRFAQKTPVCVMLRATMEYALDADFVDAVFESTTKRQYTHRIRFSDLVAMMGGVVGHVFPTVNAAYHKLNISDRASRQAAYAKISNVEPPVAQAFLRESSLRMAEVVELLQKQNAPPRLFPGIVVRVVDGNHLASTERRLDVLRDVAAGPLPGLALVVYDPDLRLVVDAYPCEDGHAQERSLLYELTRSQKPGELYIMDRAGCTTQFLYATILNKAYFLVRQHATNAPWRDMGKLRKRADDDDGTIYEQSVQLTGVGADGPVVRRIVKRLHSPLRDGSRELVVLTNLPKKHDARRCLRGYKERWSIENMFGALAQGLNCEIASLCRPMASLFAFTVGLVLYNLLSVVRWAIHSAHGAEAADNVSAYHLAVDFRSTMQGMLVAVPEESWTVEFGTLTAAQMARKLKKLARQVDLKAYLKARRGPKQPRDKPSLFKDKRHVSTARLLAAAADA